MKVDLALLKRIHENISSSATGSPECFAEKLEISKRYLYMNIEYLKTNFNAPIAYSRSRETFYLTEDWELYVGNLNQIRTEVIKDIFEKLSERIK